jgi:hypothetical protein
MLLRTELPLPVGTFGLLAKQRVAQERGVSHTWRRAQDTAQTRPHMSLLSSLCPLPPQRAPCGDEQTLLLLTRHIFPPTDAGRSRHVLAARERPHLHSRCIKFECVRNRPTSRTQYSPGPTLSSPPVRTRSWSVSSSVSAGRGGGGGMQSVSVCLSVAPRSPSSSVRLGSLLCVE